MPSIALVKRASEELKRQQQLTSQILRSLRELRRLPARQVAKAMGMELRTYYTFETGQGPLEIAKIWRFADAVDADPVAIIEGLMLGSLDHALRSHNNKAASIHLASFRKFEDRVGDRGTNIAPQYFIEAYKRAYDSLEEHLQKRDQSTERWLEENLPRIASGEKD